MSSSLQLKPTGQFVSHDNSQYLGNATTGSCYCCISQFFVLSGRGDRIVSKDFRFDVGGESDAIFWHHYKFWEDDEDIVTGFGEEHPTPEPPPVFNVDGVNYFWIKRNHLIFVVTSRRNDSPATLIEFLVRLCTLFKDYTGLLTEEALRKNFTLIYELVDEAVDFGFIQETTTERIKPLVTNDTLSVDEIAGNHNAIVTPDWKERLKEGKFTISKKVENTAAKVPVMNTNGRNELFVDILEKLTVVLNPDGKVVTRSIEGQIAMKSYLQSNVQVLLGLTESLVIGRDKPRKYTDTFLDVANFHDSVNLDRLDRERVLSLHPPDGETAIMNYKITDADFKLPFTSTVEVVVISPFSVELIVRLRSETTHAATNVCYTIPVPKSTTNARAELGMGAMGQATEFRTAERCLMWKIRNLKGETEHILRAKVSLGTATASTFKKEIGSTHVLFEIPNWNVSGFDLEFLKLEVNGKPSNALRWVRHVTMANSYVFRQ